MSFPEEGFLAPQTLFQSWFHVDLVCHISLSVDYFFKKLQIIAGRSLAAKAGKLDDCSENKGDTWMNSIIRVFGLVAALLCLQACTNNYATLPSAGALPAANVADQAANYRIGPGDVLNVFVWHNSDLTSQMPVRPDGRIALPLVGDVVAAGLTPTELAAQIQDKLKAYVKDPLVTVIPTQFVGLFTRQIRVIGEAVQPRAIPYSANMTVLDVMIEVGGLTKYADGDNAVLVRAVDGKQQSYAVHLDSLVRDGDVSQNVAMQPGDILIIPQRFF
jgi:polysaccharide biosynthesis/export protein